MLPHNYSKEQGGEPPPQKAPAMHLCFISPLGFPSPEVCEGKESTLVFKKIKMCPHSCL